MKKKRNKQGERKREWSVKRLLSAAVVILVLCAIVFVFRHLGVLDRLETTVLDVYARGGDAPADSDVAVVKIDDEDYKTIFKGMRPLNPFKLEEIISAIALGQPKVIGVDIDTSPKQFRELSVQDWWPPVIWEREAESEPEFVDERPRLLDVLGGQNPALNQNSGLPYLIEDSGDKVTRRYRRLIETSEGLVASFPWAVVSRLPAESKTRALKASTQTYLINYGGEGKTARGFTANASRVLELARGDGWRNDSPIKNRIVLLGGTYLEQDKHHTPLGQMYGVDIMARVIETELQGGGYKSPGSLVIILMEAFDGIILLLILHTLGTRRGALLCVLLVIPALSLLCSFLAFDTLARWAFFAPVLVGVLVYELYQEYRRSLIEFLSKQFGRSSHHVK